MARHPRLTLTGIPLHVIQRGHNRTPCFFGDNDQRVYLQHLGELATKFSCRVHAYVLMTNHAHLLLTPDRADGVSMLMKHLGQRYVQYVNRVYRRSGTLWEGRFRSSLVQADTYLLRCQCYIELNPVRADMVGSPGEYRWSSFGANALGRSDALISPHSAYLALGRGDSDRRSAYLELFRGEIAPEDLNQIRTSTNAGHALGNERFRRQIEQALGRRAGPGKPGRPAREYGEDAGVQREASWLARNRGLSLV